MAGGAGRCGGMIPSFQFDEASRQVPAAGLRRAVCTFGCFYARHPLFPAARCRNAQRDARAFFDQTAEAKRSLAIEGSAHFRGYSEMRNARDCREQIHFGREEPAGDSVPDYARLRGPNQWPESAAWRTRTLRLMADLECAGRDILGALARSLDLPATGFLEQHEEPYTLMKLIHYPATNAPRPGVAAHVDFSWITLLLQDDAGGLEMRSRQGVWMAVPPIEGALVVNLGEILQFATGGYFAATPHRVQNRSAWRSRLSIPYFLNPGLNTTVMAAPLSGGHFLHAGFDSDSPEHVHRALSGGEREAFLFGQAEWRRKALGAWCASCVQKSTLCRAEASPAGERNWVRASE